MTALIIITAAIYAAIVLINACWNLQEWRRESRYGSQGESPDRCRAKARKDAARNFFRAPLFPFELIASGCKTLAGSWRDLRADARPDDYQQPKTKSEKQDDYSADRPDTTGTMREPA